MAKSLDNSDLVSQKWLDNDFYGTVFSANYKNEKLNLVMGGAWNRYEGAHYGKVIWAHYVQATYALMTDIMIMMLQKQMPMYMLKPISR